MLGIMSPLGEAVHTALVEKGKFAGKVQGNEFNYFCPFHEDTRKPNMWVNYEKGSFYCFACMVGGSLEQLYAYLYDLPSLPINPFSTLSKYAYWRDIWQRKTLKAEEGEMKRLSNLRKISIDLLEAADVRKLNGGLNEDEPAAQFKDCFLFPSYDTHRKILLSFVGYNANAKKKYINPTGVKVSPFGFHLFLPNGDNIFVTEGVFDALTFREVGANAVALLGTNQGENISYIPTGKKLVLLPDFDTAGMVARRKWAFEALLAGFYDAEVWLPTDGVYELGKDANDIWRKSKEAMYDLVEGKLTESINVCDYLIEDCIKEGNPVYPILDAIAICAPFPVYANALARLGGADGSYDVDEVMDRLSKLFTSSLPYKKVFTLCRREIAYFLIALRSVRGRQIILDYFLPHEIAPFNRLKEINGNELPGLINESDLRKAVKRLAKVVRGWSGSSLEELASIFATQCLIDDLKGGEFTFEGSLEELVFTLQDLEEEKPLGNS